MIYFFYGFHECRHLCYPLLLRIQVFLDLGHLLGAGLVFRFFLDRWQRYKSRPFRNATLSEDCFSCFLGGHLGLDFLQLLDDFGDVFEQPSDFEEFSLETSRL